MAGVTTTKKAHVSHDMGMHTEGLRGRTPAALLRHHGGEGRLRLSRCARCRLQQAGRDRLRGARRRADQPRAPRSDQAGLRHHRAEQSGREAFACGRHPQPAELYHRRHLRLFRLRPARRAECAHQGPRRLGVRRKHAGRHHRDREECRLAVRRGLARRRSRLQGLGRRAHRHRPEGRHDHRRRRHRLLHRLHDAARPHGDLRQCRQESRRLDV